MGFGLYLFLLSCFTITYGQFRLFSTRIPIEDYLNQINSFNLIQDGFLISNNDGLHLFDYKGEGKLLFASSGQMEDGTVSNAKFHRIMDVKVHKSEWFILDNYILRKVSNGQVTSFPTVLPQNTSAFSIAIDESFFIAYSDPNLYYISLSNLSDLSNILNDNSWNLYVHKQFPNAKFFHALKQNQLLLLESNGKSQLIQINDTYEPLRTFGYPFGVNPEGDIAYFFNIAYNLQSGKAISYEGIGYIKNSDNFNLNFDNPRLISANENDKGIAFATFVETNVPQYIFLYFDLKMVRNLRLQNVFYAGNGTLSLNCTQEGEETVFLPFISQLSSNYQGSTRNFKSTCMDGVTMFNYSFHSASVLTGYMLSGFVLDSFHPDSLIQVKFEGIGQYTIGDLVRGTILGCEDCWQQNSLTRVRVIYSSGFSSNAQTYSCVNNTGTYSLQLLESGLSVIQLVCPLKYDPAIELLMNVSIPVKGCDDNEFYSEFTRNCMKCFYGTRQSDANANSCQFCPLGSVLLAETKECLPCTFNDCKIPMDTRLTQEDYDYFLTPRSETTEQTSLVLNSTMFSLIAIIVLISAFLLLTVIAFIALYLNRSKTTHGNILRKCDIFFKRSTTSSEDKFTKIYLPSATGGAASILYIVAVLFTITGLIIDFNFGVVLTPNNSGSMSIFSLPLSLRLKVYAFGDISGTFGEPKYSGIYGDITQKIYQNYSGGLTVVEWTCTDCKLSIPSTISLSSIGRFISAIGWEVQIDSVFDSQPKYFSEFAVTPPPDKITGVPTYLANEGFTVYPTFTATEVKYPGQEAQSGFIVLPSQRPVFGLSLPYNNTSTFMFQKNLAFQVSLLIPSQISRFVVVRTKNIFVLLTQCISVMGGLFFMFKVFHRAISSYLPNFIQSDANELIQKTL